MKIHVTRTTVGSEDGVTPKTYEQGQTYEMGDDLTRVFLREGWGHEAAPEGDTEDDAPEDEAPEPGATDDEGGVQPKRRKWRKKR